MLFLAGELAENRKARGLKLNYPEAIALISSHLQEAARDSRSVADLWGGHVVDGVVRDVCQITAQELIFLIRIPPPPIEVQANNQHNILRNPMGLTA